MIPPPIIELRLHPDDVPALLKQPLVRAGRARPCRILWHDTQDAALLAAGHALSEMDGVWQLEALHPGAMPDAPAWLPATPPPVLTRAAAQADLPGPAAGAAPLARLEGDARLLEWGDADDPARIELLHGRLHGDDRDWPCCQLRLSGSGPALDAMLTMLGALRVSVPRASLAAEACGLARRQHPSPRHTGGPHIGGSVSIADGFTVMAGFLVDVALYWSARIEQGDCTEAVHQMRVALRRLRSLLSLFKRALDPAATAELNTRLKELGRQLGAARDWDVFLHGTAADLVRARPEDARLPPLLKAATRRRNAVYRELRQALAAPAFRSLELHLLRFVLLRPWLSEQTAAQLAAPLAAFAARTLSRKAKHVARQADDLLALDVEQRHHTRKMAKRLRYAAEFVAPLFAAKPARRYIRRVNALQDALGDMNDAHTLDDLLTQLGGTGRGFAAGLAQGYAAHTAMAARPDVARAWNRFRAARRFWT